MICSDCTSKWSIFLPLSSCAIGVAQSENHRKLGNASESPTNYHTTTAPYHTTTAPYHTTTAPYHTTTAPYHTTTAPYHTTTAPYHTTTAPYHTTTAPYHTTTAPYHTTTAPYHTTSRPMIIIWLDIVGILHRELDSACKRGCVVFRSLSQDAFCLSNVRNVTVQVFRCPSSIISSWM
ncbi:hypothetical protein LSAT2_027822 [Lamellibrachia satsuma]|nr:hypothetical protein LSAT2_027822 [Lamellibrachia satsuma]